MTHATIVWFDQIGLKDVPQVGGKNASLGEMIQHLTPLGIKVPTGFALTAQAYREFLTQAGLTETINQQLANLKVENLEALAQVGNDIRASILKASFEADFINDITQAYDQLVEKVGTDATFAVRSSATAEDLPQASFAGQQETLLNIAGHEGLLAAIKQVYASLYTDRAIAYRVHQGFDHVDVALSVGVQQMVRSDLAASGVMFTLDTESGFEDVVLVTSSYGLGETVVQGSVNPDEFYVHKPILDKGFPAILRRTLGSKAQKMVYSKAGKGDAVHLEPVSDDLRTQFSLSDEEIMALAKQAVAIEKHYARPMDIEWAKDGLDGELYIVQARPETVKSKKSAAILERYELHDTGNVLITGRSVGQAIGHGPAKVIKSLEEITRVQNGDVLVTDMTDPDWEPVMQKASAIVTNRGGRTCHAAIIARELGIPAVVGTGEGTRSIQDGQTVTVCCANGDVGEVYDGEIAYEVKRVDVKNIPELPVDIMLNVGNPDRAFAFHAIPNHGVGLARLEFIISNMIGVHPKALLEFVSLPKDVQTPIAKKMAGYDSPVEFYIEKLREGIATIAAAFYPKPVIVRLSDFKSNEYANLLGGHLFEPEEENPMIGFRGASRYIAESFRECFAMECKAVKRVRETMGLTNVAIMIPFVRSLQEAERVCELLEENGLKRGEHGLKVIMMCELPTNALLADDYLKYFDGFSIGSNDLTQLTLGLDRDSALIAQGFDERDPAVKTLLKMAIDACLKANKYIGICGQGPSDHEDLAHWLMAQGIQSMSLNPDSVIPTLLALDGSR